MRPATFCIIIAIKNKGFSKTFTLRRRVQGIGIEQIFPYYSPKISSISKDSAPIFRRSKLFYLRFLLGKASQGKKK